MHLKLPLRFRPDCEYKKAIIGDPGDFPAWFIEGLHALEPHAYPVWHQFELNFDLVMNMDGDGLDKFVINNKFGGLNFGRVCMDPENVQEPKYEGMWHLWRLHKDGWSHFCRIDSTESKYLKQILDMLLFQDRFISRYGAKAYTQYLENKDEWRREKEKELKKDEYNEWHYQNKDMVDRARDNFERGITKPTNPTKKIVKSGPGGMVDYERPLTDEDVLTPVKK